MKYIQLYTSSYIERTQDKYKLKSTYYYTKLTLFVSLKFLEFFLNLINLLKIFFLHIVYLSNVHPGKIVFPQKASSSSRFGQKKNFYLFI